MTSANLDILISNHDLRAAEAAWLAALEQGQPVARVRLLFDDIQRLTKAQMQQIDDDFCGDI